MQLITEHIPNRFSAGGEEAALVRVFIASLFGGS
jgi:hypothetical protein